MRMLESEVKAAHATSMHVDPEEQLLHDVLHRSLTMEMDARRLHHKNTKAFRLSIKESERLAKEKQEAATKATRLAKEKQEYYLHSCDRKGKGQARKW